jgi:hypothetical protein
MRNRLLRRPCSAELSHAIGSKKRLINILSIFLPDRLRGSHCTNSGVKSDAPLTETTGIEDLNCPRFWILREEAALKMMKPFLNCNHIPEGLTTVNHLGS